MLIWWGCGCLWFGVLCLFELVFWRVCCLLWEFECWFGLGCFWFVLCVWVLWSVDFWCCVIVRVWWLVVWFVWSRVVWCCCCVVWCEWWCSWVGVGSFWGEVVLRLWLSSKFCWFLLFCWIRLVRDVLLSVWWGFFCVLIGGVVFIVGYWCILLFGDWLEWWLGCVVV